MSCGAIEAGAKVVLAVDSDPAPLKVLGSNAPATTCVVATLGEGRDDVVLPPAAPDLHVHVSRAAGSSRCGAHAHARLLPLPADVYAMHRTLCCTPGSQGRHIRRPSDDSMGGAFRVGAERRIVVARERA